MYLLSRYNLLLSILIVTIINDSCFTTAFAVYRGKKRVDKTRGSKKPKPKIDKTKKKQKEPKETEEKETYWENNYIPYSSKNKKIYDTTPPVSENNNNIPSYTKDTSSTTKEFINFLIKEDRCEGIENTEIGFASNTNLRGIYAGGSFSRGARICAIPFITSLLLDETLIYDGGRVIKEEDDDAYNGLRLIRFLEFLNKDLTSYFNCIPEMNGNNIDNIDHSTPDLWSDTDIRRLEIPTMIQRTLKRKRNTKELYQGEEEDQIELAKPNSGYSKDSISLEELQRAAYVVRTRAFTTYQSNVEHDINVIGKREGVLRRTVLIPFIDMCNHHPLEKANVELRVIETDEYSESFYALHAIRPISEGSELRICYGTGTETTLDLFRKYGFIDIDENNIENYNNCVLTDKNFAFTTSLEDDLTKGKRENLTKIDKTILSLRIHMKKLLLSQIKKKKKSP